MIMDVSPESGAGSVQQSGGGYGGDIVSGAAAVADTIINAVQNKKNREQQWDMFNQQQQFDMAQMERANEMNRDNLNYQFQKNLEMWKMQNAYNSPAAQRQRLLAAGINPSTIDGATAADGVQFGNVATPTPTNSAPLPTPLAAPINIQQSLMNFANLMMAFKSIQKQDKEIEAIDEHNNLTKAQTNEVLARFDKLMAGKNYWQLQESYNTDLLKYNNDLLKERIKTSIWENEEKNPLAKRLMEIQRDVGMFDLNFKNESKADMLKKIKWDSSKMYEDWKAANTDNLTRYGRNLEDFTYRLNQNQKMTYLLDLFKAFDKDGAFDEIMGKPNPGFRDYFPFIWKSLLLFGGMR